jgi:hypothetical protein
MEGSAPSGAENQGLGIVEGSTPSKMEEKPTSNVSVGRAGYVGAPATPGVMAHRGREKNLWMMVRTWTNWNLQGNRSGRAGHKEGAVVASTAERKRATGRKVRRNQAQPSEE